MLECGADVTAKDNDGWTPLEVARRNQQTDAVEFLLSHQKARTVSHMAAVACHGGVI